MKKVIYIFKEMFSVVRKHKLYFLFPLFIILVLLAFLVYFFGPAVIKTSVIYAGF